ncbi:fimbrial protein [Bacteroides acidifaciens]|jgi:putative copper export protein|uniref:fimbrial protein n=1 Tax=Bacteroides acidifaciens TaxID=85831 RepID=UPI0025581EB3|nr:fimbrial protein [Bacteroides acidifaciens]
MLASNSEGSSKSRLDKIVQTVFLLQKLNKEVVPMLKQERGRKSMLTVYWTIIAFVSAMIVVMQPVFAAESETIWDRFSAIMRDFYGQIVAISTIVAVTMAAVALIVRLVSRNQKAVDEATAWLKRIVITWIILNSLGFIVAYIQPLIIGGNYGG